MITCYWLWLPTCNIILSVLLSSFFSFVILFSKCGIADVIAFEFVTRTKQIDFDFDHKTFISFFLHFNRVCFFTAYASRTLIYHWNWNISFLRDIKCLFSSHSLRATLHWLRCRCFESVSPLYLSSRIELNFIFPLTEIVVDSDCWCRTHTCHTLSIRIPIHSWYLVNLLFSHHQRDT